MSHAGTEDRFLEKLIKDNLEGINVLDAGIGYGYTGLFIRTKLKGWCILYGVDVFKPYVDLHERIKIYDHVYHLDAKNLEIFGDDHFKISVAQHIVEHMNFDDALLMINELERVSSDMVVICTPNGLTESGPLDDNEYNNHLSGWTVEDFKELEYKTMICTKNVNSRALLLFARFWFWLRKRNWENEVIVAWKKF